MGPREARPDDRLRAISKDEATEREGVPKAQICRTTPSIIC